MAHTDTPIENAGPAHEAAAGIGQEPASQAIGEAIEVAAVHEPMTEPSIEAAPAVAPAQGETAVEAASNAGQELAHHAIDEATEAAGIHEPFTEPTAEAAPADARVEGETAVAATHAAASVAEKLTDQANANGHAMLRSAMPFLDIYRDAARRSADHMQSLVGAWMTVSLEIQATQLTLLESVGRTLVSATGKPTEVWQVQRQLYVKALDTAVDSTNRLMALASRSARADTQPAGAEHG